MIRNPRFHLRAIWYWRGFMNHLHHICTWIVCDSKPSWEINESYHKRSNTVVLAWRKNARRSPKIRFLARAIVSSRLWLVPPSHVVGWSHPPTYPPHCASWRTGTTNTNHRLWHSRQILFFIHCCLVRKSPDRQTLNPAGPDSTKFKLILCNSPIPIHILSPYGRKVVFFSPWHIT